MVLRVCCLLLHQRLLHFELELHAGSSTCLPWCRLLSCIQCKPNPIGPYCKAHFSHRGVDNSIFDWGHSLQGYTNWQENRTFAPASSTPRRYGSAFVYIMNDAYIRAHATFTHSSQESSRPRPIIIIIIIIIGYLFLLLILSLHHHPHCGVFTSLHPTTWSFGCCDTVCLAPTQRQTSLV